VDPARAFELPTARGVVGRGLQLALDAAAEIRRASLYVGLLVAAVVGPATVLLIADLPRLAAVPWDNPESMTPDQAVALAALIWPLYAAGSLALLGVIPVLLDGQLMVATLLAGRLAGMPVTIREALARARQVFWRYGLAAFGVGLLSAITSLIVNVVAGTFVRGESIGSSLFAAFIAAIVTAPFGYILAGVVVGDVSGGTALARSVTLARARPALALVVAAFAFLSSSLTVLGIGVGLEVVGDIVLVLRPVLRPDPLALLVAIAAASLGLVAYGSLSVTVAALAASPQVAAFLGLTQYSAGLERARLATPGRRRARWVTGPMAVLIGLEVVVVVIGLAAASGSG
jgi:hypothetical protein